MADPRPAQQGLYDAQFEHDACGVGVVANLSGEKTHRIVDQGIEILENLEHRGALGADPETGDGAGILIQMPDAFFRTAANLPFNLPPESEYAVGMIFLPQAADEQARCRTIIEDEVARGGLPLLGWRDVPVDHAAIGTQARKVVPTIVQVFVGRAADTPDVAAFERRLYVVRRRIENAVDASGIGNPQDFYIPSFFSSRIVYKGLLITHQVQPFYRDLDEPTVTSAFAIVHSRFSTNTLGSWRLAHPYRYLAHNGEINTLRGNINWMTARQADFTSDGFMPDEMASLFPIIPPAQSDTAGLDNALELLLNTGRSLPHCLMMMIPEAWEQHRTMSQERRDFYAYHAALQEPWDGPAMVAATDGHHIGVVLDRNGLRPLRYTVTKGGLVVMGSETGVLAIPPEEVEIKGRVEPGRIFLIDMEQGRLVPDEEVKAELATRQPYGRWLEQERIRSTDLPDPEFVPGDQPATLQERQRQYGYTEEELEILMVPMAANAKEPVGSMGNDTPLAVLSQRPQPLFNYFKQLFAQVTNPPLDAQWEQLVTSTDTLLGSRLNLFEESPAHARQLHFPSPVITNHALAQVKALDLPGLRSATLPIVFEASDEGALRRALDALRQAASKAVDEGATILVLSDRDVNADHAPIPSLLAVAAVHHHLIREGRRMKVGLVLESGEPRETHHFALLLGYGAGLINPYLALESLHALRDEGVLPRDWDDATVDARYLEAADKGIVKVMSKMGISTVSCYRGAQIFEAIGLGRALVDEFFTGTPTRIGGIGLDAVEAEALAKHRRAHPERIIPETLPLERGGVYHWRRDGEHHMVNPDTVGKIQEAVQLDSYPHYQEFARLSDDESRQHATIRGLLEFRRAANPIPIEEVEPVEEIVKRFATGAISFGSISQEAHETLAIAMNRLGAKSNTGEGGEDSARFTPDANGDSRMSAIKQVASGRFGVTSNYLANATDIQIKMAQGAKPGEGGQLPGHKVDAYIGQVRHSTPGVELISPPPHHDIYSIEDLAELIHDLKNANPAARIHVKLVAEVGVGTIAAGVAKGHAEVVLISGDSGGTGASPQSSIKHTGLPWELGVAETQQVLVQNDLRGRIVVQTDGQLKTGRDVAIACLLGAEEFGFSTLPLITIGCIMLRKCHLNTCSVGIATQEPALRARFAGKPEYVMAYFRFVAQHLREIMASLGLRTVDEMVGRTDLLEASTAVEFWKARGLDLTPLLYRPDVPDSVARHCQQPQDHGLERALDHVLIEGARAALEQGTPVDLGEIPTRNRNRTVGAMLSWEVSKRYGDAGLPDGTIRAHLRGSVGQSFGAFLQRGIDFTLEGDSNDYLGKGMTGGRITVRPPREATFVPEDQIIVGNVALYGATAGEVYVRGRAGERFAVRNSGGRAVVEGVGDHACEYMTGGLVVVLGPTGRNFAAGMSGGLAYVLDEPGDFEIRCNTDIVDLERVEEAEDLRTLRTMIETHVERTNSQLGQRILDNWDAVLPKFVKVFPKAFKRVLQEAAEAAARADRTTDGASGGTAADASTGVAARG